MYYDTINAVGIDHLHQVRQARPNISLPKSPTPEDLLSVGIVKVTDSVPTNPDSTRVIGKTVELIDGKYTVVYSYEPIPFAEQFAKKKKVVEEEIVKLIQSKVDEYNDANGLSYKDIYSCALYKDTTGYTHAQFCTNIWAWQTSVWEYLRQVQTDILAGARTEPMLIDLMEELPKFTG